MDPHSFIARAEAQRWLGIAEKLLMGHDLVGSKTFAIRARDSDPRLEAAEQILAIADTLLAAEKRIVGSNGTQQPDYYAILQLVRFVQDTDQIASQFRRLAVALNPHQNRFPYSDQAFQLVNDAWAVLSNPMRKSMYDSELDFPPQQQMNTIGFNLEQQQHHQHHHQQHQQQQQHQHQHQQQQHNFFSINHMGSSHSSHEQELPEPTFQTRVQQSHQQQQQLQQHNFLSQPSPVRQEQLFQHREQEHLFQPQAQPFQVASPPHQQTRQPSQPPPPPQVQPFQVTSPPHQQSRQSLQAPKQEQLFHHRDHREQEQLFQTQAQPFQVASPPPPHQQARQPPQPQVQPFQVTSPPHHQTRQPPPQQQQPQASKREQEQLFHHREREREQEQLFQSPAQLAFQVTSPPHQQQPRQPVQQQPQPTPAQVQPFQITSPPHHQSRQPPQQPPPPPQVQPFQVTSPPHQQTRQPSQPPPQPRMQSPPPPPQRAASPQPPPFSWTQTSQQSQSQSQPTTRMQSPPPQPKPLPPQSLPQAQPQQPPPPSPPQSQPPAPQFWPQQPPDPQPQQQLQQEEEQPQPQPQLQPQPPPPVPPPPEQQEEQESPENNVAEPMEIPTLVNNDNGVMEEEVESEPEEPEIVDDSPTFWTSCPFCFYMYEYPRVYAECTMRCDHCQRAFQAVRIPSPPQIAEGQDAYFCCWGYFPLGVSMSHMDKNNSHSNKKTWTPFSPMFNASGNQTQTQNQNQNQNQNHLNGDAAPKENTFVNKSSGPRIHYNDVDISDDVFMEVSEPSSDSDSDSDSEWGSTRRKKRKRVAFKNRSQVLAIYARDVKNEKFKNVGNEESGKKNVGNGNVIPRRQSGRVGKEMGRLDLNVEFNNNEGGHGHGQGEGGGGDDNVAGNGFFEGLDEFLSSLPILSVVNEEKVKA